MARRRKTLCANPDCRIACIPGARGMCEACLRNYRAGHDRARIGHRERGHYDAAWRRRSKREIRQHVAIHGYLCPWCPDADPEKNPLTLDHVTARDDSATQVICRSCNARKGNKEGPK